MAMLLRHRARLRWLCEWEEDRSANGPSASVGLAGRIMRSKIRDRSGWMRPDCGGACELPIRTQGRIFLVNADRP